MVTRHFWREQYQRLQAIAQRPDVARALRFVQAGVFAFIVVWLIWRLTAIGWRDVLSALPTSPWFYIFFALRFLILPLSELAIYERLWRIRLIRHFPVFIRKRVFNAAVAGYSGEAFLTLWARRTLPLSGPDILRAIKDNNILSALVSNMTTVLIIAALYITGVLNVGLEALPRGASALIGLAFVIALSLTLSVVVFRKRLIALSAADLRAVIGLHGVRTGVIMLLHTAMYAAALPASPLSAWFLFIAVQLVISRMPFVPNQDLVFLGVALSMASLTGAPEAAIAGMLLAESALGQAVNLTLFLATSYLARPGEQQNTAQNP